MIEDDKLPWYMTQEQFNNCKRIVSKLSGKEDVEQLALKIANICYAKGGDYSTKTLTAFTTSFLETASKI